MDSVCSDRGLLCRVSPFRDPRINGYLLLPAAFRSLSRLSSALSAKASTLCSFLLDLRALSGTRQPYSVTLTVFSLSALSFPFQRLTPDEIESNFPLRIAPPAAHSGQAPRSRPSSYAVCVCQPSGSKLPAVCLPHPAQSLWITWIFDVFSSSICGFQGTVPGGLPPMEMRGFEPLTPCLQGRCSPN